MGLLNSDDTVYEVKDTDNHLDGPPAPIFSEWKSKAPENVPEAINSSPNMENDFFISCDKHDGLLMPYPLTYRILITVIGSDNLAQYL